MRAPPPVRVLSDGAGLWRGIQWSLRAAAAGVVSYWAATQLLGPDARMAAACVLVGLLWAFVEARRPPEPARHLAWDGQVWTLSRPAAEPVAGRVAVMLDLGSWMLLRFDRQPPARPGWRGRVWLPLKQSDAGVAWPAVRAALFAPHADAASTGPHPPTRPAA